MQATAIPAGAYDAFVNNSLADPFLAKTPRLDHAGMAREIKRLEKLMLEHARNLEFEKAAQMRDQLHRLKERVLGAPGLDHVA